MSKRRRLGHALIAGLLSVTASLDAAAEPATTEQEPASSWASSRALREHFGVEAARRLLQGGDVVDATTASADTLRGIERAAGLGSPEAVALLVRLLQDPHGAGRSNARVLLATTRALAPFAADPAVARALADVTLNAPHAGASSRSASEVRSSTPDANRRGRIELARETAALALAETRDEHAFDLLVLAARETGPGRTASLRALATFPGAVVAPPVASTPDAIARSVAGGDLRAADTLLAASRSLDTKVRVAALRGLAMLGDTRGIRAAEASAHDPDATVREAAARALLDLGAADTAHAVRQLIEDDATAECGIELSTRVTGSEVMGALAARVRVSSDLALRRAAIAALGRQDDPDALAALGEFLADPLLVGDAAQAIARSPRQVAWRIVAEVLRDPAARRMGARMAALRGRVFAHVPDDVARSLDALARTSDGADRAAGLSALVLLGGQAPEAALADGDVRVRRAVAMACEPTMPTCGESLLRRLASEGDAETRLLLASGLVSADSEAVTTVHLLERARQRDTDTPLSVLALARRAGDSDRDAVDTELRSADPLHRAHAARGLALTVQPWAAGRLAEAYDAEVDAGVRRTILLALAARKLDASTPLRARILDLAARLDPEPSIRAVAERARRGQVVPDVPPPNDVLWLRVMTRSGAPPPSSVAGLVLRADGLAVPVLFDEDGYAILPAPAGPARLLLAPRLHAYDAERHDP